MQLLRRLDNGTVDPVVAGSIGSADLDAVESGVPKGKIFFLCFIRRARFGRRFNRRARLHVVWLCNSYGYYLGNSARHGRMRFVHSSQRRHCDEGYCRISHSSHHQSGVIEAGDAKPVSDTGARCISADFEVLLCAGKLVFEVENAFFRGFISPGSQVRVLSLLFPRRPANAGRFRF
jgi:hypothetical protein